MYHKHHDVSGFSKAIILSRWWRGLAVTRWSRSTKLPYAGPG